MYTYNTHVVRKLLLLRQRAFASSHRYLTHCLNLLHLHLVSNLLLFRQRA